MTPEWSLLGEHNQIVDSLVATLDSLQAGDKSTPRLVVLRAPSGYGKSRIVREVYDRLRLRQPEPPFWGPLPERHVDDDGIPVPLGERKVIGPPLSTFIWPADALPSFAWWALNCERGSDKRRSNVLADARERFTVWLPPLTQSWAKKVGVWDRLVARRRDIAEMLRDAAAGEATDAVLNELQQALNVTIPGVGTAVGWAWRLGKAGVRRREARIDLTSNVELGPRLANQREAAAAEMAMSILQLTRLDLPAVVVIEDAHHAPGELLSVLDQLKEPSPGSPVLIILTCWPEGELRSSWDSWLQAAEEAGLSRTIDVPRLSDADLCEIILRYAPATAEADAHLLARAMPSPLLLELWLTLESTQHLLRRHDGAIPAHRALRQGLPSTLAEVYRKRWDELTPSVQRALTAAIGLSDPDDPVPSFLPDVVAEAAAPSLDLVPQELTQALALAVDPAAWASSDGGVTSFREAALARQVRAALTLDDDVLAEMRGAARDLLRAWIAARIEDQYWLGRTAETSVAADWLLDLTEGGLDGRADVAAAWLQARELYDKGRSSDVIALLRQCPWDEPVEDAVWMTVLLAEAHDDIGHADAAIALIDAASTRLEGLFGADAPDVLRLRSRSASITGHAMRQADAVRLYDRLIPELESSLGAGHEQTLEARTSRAFFSGQLGHYPEAIETLRAVVQDAAASDVDPRVPLVARFALCRILVEAGDLTQATSLFDDLIAELTEVLGPEDPLTICAQFWKASAFLDLDGSNANGSGAEMLDLLEGAGMNAGPFAYEVMILNLINAAKVDPAAVLPRLTAVIDEASALFGPESAHVVGFRAVEARMASQAGQHVEARALIETVVATMAALHGPAHPRTLVARASHALIVQLGPAGPAVAAAIYDELIPVLREVLGDLHSATLQSRSNRASCLLDLGDAEAAAAEFAEVVPHMVRLLGPYHLDTLTTEHKFARALAEVGRVEEGIQLIEEVIEARTQRNGAHDPDTLASRQRLSSMLTARGDHARAAATLRAQLASVIEVHGRDHPQTRDVLDRLANALGESGEFAEAIAIYEDLLRTPTDGSDSVDRVRWRSNLAHWLGRDGRSEDSVATHRQAQAERLRRYGRHHAETLKGRHALGYQLGVSGDVSGALHQYRRLVRDRTRILGERHADTIAARQSLTYWLRASSDRAEARQASSALLDDLARWRGEDDPLFVSLRREVGDWLVRTEQFADAVPLLEGRLAHQEATVGAAHPDALTVRASLANALGRSGELAAAVEQYQQVFDARTALLGADHPDTLAAGHSLGFWHEQSEALEPAAHYYRMVLAARETSLGPDHAVTAITRRNLIDVLLRNGQPEEAVPLLRSAVDHAARTLGPDHPKTIAVQALLGRALVKSGNPEAAIPHLAAVVAAHPDDAANASSGNAEYHLAHALAAAGRTDEAIARYRHVWAEEQRALGPTDPSTLITRTELAAALEAVGQHAEALPHREALWRALKERRGENHAATLKAQYDLAAALRRNGDPEQALEHFQDFLAAGRVEGWPGEAWALPSEHAVADLLHELGRADEAGPHYQAVLRGLDAQLGRGEPRLVAKRHEIVVRMVEGGLVREAIEELQALADALTESHPSSMEAQSTLELLAAMQDAVQQAQLRHGWQLALSGRLDEAIAALGQVGAATSAGSPDEPEVGVTPLVEALRLQRDALARELNADPPLPFRLRAVLPTVEHYQIATAALRHQAETQSTRAGALRVLTLLEGLHDLFGDRSAPALADAERLRTATAAGDS